MSAADHIVRHLQQFGQGDEGQEEQGQPATQRQLAGTKQPEGCQLGAAPYPQGSGLHEPEKGLGASPHLEALACSLRGLAVAPQQATLPGALHTYNGRQAESSRIITGHALGPEPLAAAELPPSAVLRLHPESPLLAACPGPAGLITLLQQQELAMWQQASLGQPAQGRGEQPQRPHHAVPQVSGQDAGRHQTAELQLTAEHRGRFALLDITELPDNQPAGSGAAGGCLCDTSFSEEASPEEEAVAEDDQIAPANNLAARAQAAAAPAAAAAAAEGIAALGSAPGCEASAALEDATAPGSSTAHPEAAAAREAAAAAGSLAGAAGAGAAPGSSREDAAADGHCCSSTCATAAAAGMAGAGAGAAAEEGEGPGPGDRRRRRRQVQEELGPDSLLAASVGLAGGRTKRVPGGNPLANPRFKGFCDMIRANSEEFEAQGRVLRLKQFIRADAKQAQIDAILDALEDNTRVEALYIQNFEMGMLEPQLQHLLKVLRRKHIWALNVGENFNIGMDAWEAFTAALPETAVAYLYVSEHHLLNTSLKKRMRDAIRDNRKRDPRRDPDVIVRIGNMWYNPKLPAELERSARFRAERQAAEAQAAAERVAAAVGGMQAATSPDKALLDRARETQADCEGELRLGMSCRSILVDREVQEAARTKPRKRKLGQIHALQRRTYESSGLTPQQQLAIMDAQLQKPKAARGNGPQIEGLTRCQQNALEVAADRIRQQMKKAQEQSKRAARMARRTEPATASAVAAPAAAAASAGSAEERDADVCGEGPLAVGWQLSVLWPDDQQMYSGRVTAWCSKHNFHLVTYNDGQVETLDLDEEVVQWHQAPKPLQKRVLHKKGASRARRALHRATAAAPASPVATGRNALVVADDVSEGEDDHLLQRSLAAGREQGCMLAANVAQRFSLLMAEAEAESASLPRVPFQQDLSFTNLPAPTDGDCAFAVADLPRVRAVWLAEALYSLLGPDTVRIALPPAGLAHRGFSSRPLRLPAPRGPPGSRVGELQGRSGTDASSESHQAAEERRRGASSSRGADNQPCTTSSGRAGTSSAIDAPRTASRSKKLPRLAVAACGPEVARSRAGGSSGTSRAESHGPSHASGPRGSRKRASLQHDGSTPTQEEESGLASTGMQESQSEGAAGAEMGRIKRRKPWGTAEMVLAGFRDLPTGAEGSQQCGCRAAPQAMPEFCDADSDSAATSGSDGSWLPPGAMHVRRPAALASQPRHRLARSSAAVARREGACLPSAGLPSSHPGSGHRRGGRAPTGRQPEAPGSTPCRKRRCSQLQASSCELSAPGSLLGRAAGSSRVNCKAARHAAVPSSGEASDRDEAVSGVEEGPAGPTAASVDMKWATGPWKEADLTLLKETVLASGVSLQVLQATLPMRTFNNLKTTWQKRVEPSLTAAERRRVPQMLGTSSSASTTQLPQGRNFKARPKPWEEAEVQLFIKQLRQHGPDWAAIQVAMLQRSCAALESHYIQHRSELLRHAQRGYNSRAGREPSIAGVETAVAGDDTSGAATDEEDEVSAAGTGKESESEGADHDRDVEVLKGNAAQGRDTDAPGQNVRRHRRWTAAEHELFSQQLSRHGTDWEAIQAVLPHRTVTALKQKSRKVDLNLLKHAQHGKAPVAEREHPAAAGHSVEGRARGPQAVGRAEAAALSVDTHSSLVPLAQLAAAATHSSTMPLARLASVQGQEATSHIRLQVQKSTRLRPGSSRSGLRHSKGLAGSKHMLL